MYCIDDKPNGIVINHSSNWNDDVRIAWYIASERQDPGPTPPSMQECHCVAKDLIAGRFTLLEGVEPPVNVITRAVALAVEAHLRHKMESFIENAWCP